MARELGVTYLLTGQVRQAGDRVTVAVELVQALEDRTLWSQTYKGQTKDVFGFMSQTARQVSSELNRQLSRSARQRLTQVPTQNPDAYIVAGTGSSAGITNNGSFTNTSGATIQLNRGGADSQLLNQTASFFTNQGQITLGILQGSNFGINNAGSFTHAGGNISIALANNSAILNDGTFISSAPMNLNGSYAVNEGRGIYNIGTFMNNSGSSVTINQCTRGIKNQGNFTNVARITMGASISVTTAIEHTGGAFSNSTCTSIIDLVSNSRIVTI